MCPLKSYSAFLVMVLTTIPFFGSAQENAGKEPTLERAADWSELTSEKGVTVEYKHSDCSSEKNGIQKESVLLRIENRNEEAVSVEWDQELWYDGDCRTCEVENDEHHHRIELDEGEVREGDCSNASPQYLQIFAKFLKPGKGRPDTELTGLKLADLRVK